MKQSTQNKTEVLTDGDIEKIGNLLDNRLAPLGKKQDDMALVMATKEDLRNTEESLKAYIHEGIESVMDGMDKLSEQLAEKERVDKLEKWTRQIAQKIGVNLI